MQFFNLRTMIFLVSLSSLLGCPEDKVSSFQGPNLLVNSPLHLGESPVGVRQRGRLVITNGGDAPLTIDDFKIEPDDGIFLIGIEELPLTIAGRRSKDLIISFRPRAEVTYRADLTFSSNHDGSALDPVLLMGTGISNLVCLPCEPPPEPECSADGTTSIVYVPTTSTTCESSSGFCDYQVIEMPCDDEICDEETGLCPNSTIPVYDAGVPEVDSGWDPPVCGNGIVEDDEACDDGNTNDDDGCSATCTIEDGWDCSVEPCETICGDGLILNEEVCDDGNTETETECPYGINECTACNATCSEVVTLSGRVCGDGTKDPEELCDDGNTNDDDGCSAACTIENGWTCIVEPCSAICGDGYLLGDEECDDGNTEDGDGCSDACTIEHGWDCTVEPCSAICGDTILVDGEACDDGNTIDETECDYGVPTCQTCNADCSAILNLAGRLCGDNIQDPEETCDDGNTIDETECDYGTASCALCNADCSGILDLNGRLCGDGTIDPEENCDDGNTVSETECGYGTANCALCNADCNELLNLSGRLCGDGTNDPEEECDDNNLTDGDGCSATCTVEDGWDCTIEPCTPVCGDGELFGDETCDDGNIEDGDGCSATCTIEDGWDCTDNDCEAICGDTFIVGDEVCDDGNTDEESECPYGTANCTSCNADCSANLLLQGRLCGDGTNDPEEECDDNNLTDGDGCSAACAVENGWDCTIEPCTAICGDGVKIDGEEICDDGNLISETECDYGVANCSACNDTCSGFLALQGRLCGDNTKDPEEVCDDGNTETESQCPYGEDTCTLCTADCMQVLSLNGNLCGDGNITDTEACDDGNTITETECPYGTLTCTGCNADCTLEANLIGSFCGDNIKDDEEQCDDGNLDIDDGCTPSCLTESGWDCTGLFCEPICGDGQELGGEICDDGNTIDETECDYGTPNCATCNSSCSGYLALTGRLCGDGTNDPEEICDDGNTITEFECDYGDNTCDICTSDCMSLQPATGPYCGDGQQTNDEACDDGNTITETECPYGTASCARCSADCSESLGLVGGICGDGTQDPEETCDDGNTITETECPYGTASCETCSSTCQSASTLTGRVCGDGIVDPEEECDDGANGDDTDGCFDDCTELQSSYCGDGEPDPIVSLTGGAFVHFDWTDRLSWRTPFTIEGWFYANSANENAIWGGGDTSADGGFTLRLNGSNQIAISKCRNSTCKKKYSSSVSTSVVGRWTYFAVTNYLNESGNAVVTMYLDDTENITDTSNADIFNPNVISGINDVTSCDALGLGKGRCGDNEPWEGSFDNIRFWNYALGSTEIAQSKAGTLSSSSGLLAAYSMVVNSATLLNDTGDTLLNGTLIGNAEEENSEVCDDGNNITETECPYGFPTCIACNADCTEELSLVGSYCGDGVNDGVEICDDGNTFTETECPYGTDSCNICSADCSEEIPRTGSYCGDGIIDSLEGELCDDGGPTDQCTAQCSTPTGLPPCEDGVTPETSYEISDSSFGGAGYDSSLSEYLLNPFWDYYWSKNVYPNEFLSEPMYITSLAFHVEQTSSFNFNNLQIFLKDKGTETTFPDLYTGFDDLSNGHTLVFEGNVTFNSSGWYQIDLDTPFTYDGNGRLEVLVVDFDSGSTGDGPLFTYQVRPDELLDTISYDGSDFNPETTDYVYDDPSHWYYIHHIRFGGEIGCEN